MKKSLYRILYGVSVMLFVAFAFISCTDSEDVQVDYQVTTGITAAHIFDNYNQFAEGDFDMTKDGWKLNLKVLVYNNEGSLVATEEKLCTELSDSLIYQPHLSPGVYTIISIADFREGLGGNGYKFWKITNESNLQDLSITENEVVYPVPFETLGIDVQKITVANEPITINSDIKPATALFEVFEVDKMLSYIGYKGKYSTKCLKIAQYNIRTVSYKDNIRFVGGKPTYNISEQTSAYNFAISRPYDRMKANESPISISYRAILPEESKQFTWTIYDGDIDPEYEAICKQVVGSYPKEGRSESLDIVAGRQYSLAFVLDSFGFIYEDVTGQRYNIDDKINDYFNSYQSSKIDKMINFGFEHLVGCSSKEIGNAVGVGIETEYQGTSGNFITMYLHSPETSFEQSVSASFRDSSRQKAWRIMLQLSFPLSDQFGTSIGQAMPESVFQEIWNALDKKYYHFRTVGKQTMFLDGPTKAESKVGIILDGTELDNVQLFFDEISIYI